MRLRSDLQSYLDELKERSAHESDLCKLVEMLDNSNDSNDKHEAFKQMENELERMRMTYTQLLHNHNKLRGDHHKLICKINPPWNKFVKKLIYSFF